MSEQEVDQAVAQQDVLTELGASEVLAGVAHGNHRSSAVLGRLGFVPIAHFPTNTRYQLVLA